MHHHKYINQPGSFYSPKGTNTAEMRDIRQILIVSDLHLSEGYCRENFHWHRRENFTFDDEFAEFLEMKREEARKQGGPFWLIANGDFIDFLRVTAVPENEDDLSAWKECLENITKTKLPGQKTRVMKAVEACAAQWENYFRSRCQLTGRQLQEIEHEVNYGLKTQDFKSIYRLMIVSKGHEKLFRALAQWLGEGHRLTIISGNHDQEFNQGLVQAGLLWMLEEIYRDMLSPEKAAANQAMARSDQSFKMPEKELAVLENNTRRSKNVYMRKALRRRQSEINLEESPAIVDFSELLTFERHGLEIDRSIRIEHGHRFEWITSTGDQWHEPEHQEIQLAPGSLFNRYFINRVELEVPYLDNVKPSTRVIGYLARHHLSRFLIMLFNLLKTALRLGGKRGARKLVCAGVLNAARPVLLSLYCLWIAQAFLRFGNQAWPQIWQGPQVFGISLPFYIAAPLLLIVIVLINMALKKFKLHFSADEAKASMSWPAISGEETTRRYTIYGHTHKPDMQRWENGITHINSGTWTPVFEYEGGHVRDGFTKNFVELTKTGQNWEGKLLRWNACNKSPEKIVLQ